jgi:hypothetical protein
VGLRWRRGFDGQLRDVAYWAHHSSRAGDSMGTEQQPLSQGLEAFECVTLEAEVPELLFRGMRSFLENHPQWDQHSLINSALAGFLFQNGCQERSVAKHYLDGLFLQP